MHITLPQAPSDFWTVMMINFQSNRKKSFLPIEKFKKKEFPNKKKFQVKKKEKKRKRKEFPPFPKFSSPKSIGSLLIQTFSSTIMSIIYVGNPLKYVLVITFDTHLKLKK